jgi:FkbM family methyltransferase
MRRAFKRWFSRTFNTWRAPHSRALHSYIADGFEQKRIDLSQLTADSTVLDFGGYTGNFTARALAESPATIHVFEAHPTFVAHLRERFRDAPRVIVHPFGLGAKDATLSFTNAGDASSAVEAGSKTVSAEVRSVARFFAETPGLERLDYVTINIEGGEYDLLPALMDAGLMERIGELHVQFHLFDRSHLAQRSALVERIAQTHSPMWSYPYVWEGWRKNG